MVLQIFICIVATNLVDTSQFKTPQCKDIWIKESWLGPPSGSNFYGADLQNLVQINLYSSIYEMRHKIYTFYTEQDC